MKKLISLNSIKYLLLILIIMSMFSIYLAFNIINKKNENSNNNTEKVSLVVEEEKVCDARCFLKDYTSTVDFLTKMIGIDKETIIQEIQKINEDNNFIINNIAKMQDSEGNIIDYGSFDKGFLEYLIAFANMHPELVDNTYVPYQGGAEYVENLIKYFTKIYDNVDYLTAISIGAAESGYYEVGYMLSVNNVYGGMSSNGLIVHKNIEYGVLSFIRMLSINYYGMGLTTKEAIGYVYCPTFDDEGNKMASPHWLNLVGTAMNHYANSYSDVSAEMLLNFEN